VIILLVGIDEPEVEGLGPLGEETVEAIERGAKPQLDLARHAGFRPMFPRDGGVGFAHVAGDDPAIVGQRQRDSHRAIPSETADFDCATRADQLDEERHKLSLLGRDLHSAVRHRARRFPQPPERLGFPQPILDCVGIKPIR
jgi:hypothetical protein